jgi:hypothetical protein
MLMVCDGAVTLAANIFQLLGFCSCEWHGGMGTAQACAPPEVHDLTRCVQSGVEAVLPKFSMNPFCEIALEVRTPQAAAA